MWPVLPSLFDGASHCPEGCFAYPDRGLEKIFAKGVDIYAVLRKIESVLIISIRTI